MASSQSQAKRVCCVAGCFQSWYCQGRCLSHYGALRRMSDAERQAELARPASPLPKWEYEPTPEQVIKLIEQHGENQSGAAQEKRK